jgi:hypothetical protein
MWLTPAFVRVNANPQWTVYGTPEIVQPVKLADADMTYVRAVERAGAVPVASALPHRSCTPVTDSVPAPPVPVKFVPPALCHVVAPAEDDRAANSDINAAVNTMNRVILLMAKLPS